MTTTEELWFLVGIGGFLLLFEGAISYIAEKLLKGIPKDILKFIAGVLIFALALYKLLTLPPA